MKFLFFVFLLLVTTPTPVAAATTTAQQHPRTANLFLSWKITAADAQKLARWDLVVLDAEVGARQPKLIKKMRALHPGIKILAYVSTSELHIPTDELEQEAPLRNALLAHAPEQFYVHRANGDAVYFWPNAHLMNLTGPWRALLTTFIKKKIFANPVWDGVMLDNVWDGVTWYVGDVDLDDDQKTDVPDAANAAWSDATKQLINDLRAAGPKKIIIGNGSTQFDALDGVVFENFPDHGWAETVARAREFHATHTKNPIIIFNATARNNTENQSETTMRLGLNSALLFDAYFAYDFGDTNHASLWWYPAYEQKIGAPRGAPIEISPGVWQREFSRATITVDTKSLDQPRL